VVVIAADGDEVRIGGEGGTKRLPIGGVPRVPQLIQDLTGDSINLLDVHKKHLSGKE
jgi:hypothetical protein